MLSGKDNKIINERLLEVLNNFTSCNIGLIGDLVADEYIVGMTSRVSREAPVLILSYDSQSIVPGGAANAVYNIHSLGGYVFPIGCIGNDNNGDRLKQIFRGCDIPLDGIIEDPGIMTPTKTRILAGGNNTTKQQVIRIDRENKKGISQFSEEKIIAILSSRIKEFDALIISDYSLGTITDAVIEEVNILARKKDTPVIVDSRRNILRFQHITCVTPNTEELGWAAESLSISGNFSFLCAELQKRIKSRAVLLTKGKDGMSLFEHENKQIDIDIYGTDEIADVTGAGDTVISAFALSLASGASMTESAYISNFAGGIVVTKSGTATVTSEEISNAIKSEK